MLPRPPPSPPKGAIFKKKKRKGSHSQGSQTNTHSAFPNLNKKWPVINIWILKLETLWKFYFEKDRIAHLNSDERTPAIIFCVPCVPSRIDQRHLLLPCYCLKLHHSKCIKAVCHLTLFTPAPEIVSNKSRAQEKIQTSLYMLSCK